MSKRMLLVFGFVLMLVASVHAQEPPRIFVQAGGQVKQNETAKVESELAKRCPKKVAVTAIQDKADYILHFNVNAGNDFTLFNRNGDLILRAKAMLFSQAVEKVCKAIH
jgi:hypothetical protein